MIEIANKQVKSIGLPPDLLLSMFETSSLQPTNLLPEVASVNQRL
jgi:hypothetical protein